jgi:hypothetical protein
VSLTRKKKRSHGSRGKRWTAPGASSPSSKRQQYKWQQFLGKLGQNPNLESREVQAKIAAAYKNIFGH